MRTWPALEVGPLRYPDLFQAALLDYDVSAIDETSQPDAWRVFFGSDADRTAAAEQLSREFPDAVIRVLDVPDEDWVTRSQASLRAVTIGNTVVAPPWDLHVERRLKPACYGVKPARHGVEPARCDPLIIVIRPSMGFGTGHHATTRLCLAALQRLDVRGGRVLDVGTGSGLLAIAASLYGAAYVEAIDEDADALRAAHDNVLLNPGAAVTLREVDVRRAEADPFDVVIANLTGALLRDAAPRIRELTARSACLILSGFMRSEEAEVLGAYTTFLVTTRTEEEEWLCVTLRQ